MGRIIREFSIWRSLSFKLGGGAPPPPPSLAPNPIKLEGAAPPPPALLLSSSCTTHHPRPQSLDIHHLQRTFRDAPPPPSYSHSIGEGCTTPSPQLCPSKVGGGAPPPPSCAHPRWGGYTTPPPPPPLQGERSFVYCKIDSGEEE